jgi:hypothetical protein
VSGSSSSSSSSSSGVGVFGLLGVAFVVLKLTHVIDWPWIWVLAPFWAGLALVVLFLLALVAVAVVKR